MRSRGSAGCSVPSRPQLRRSIRKKIDPLPQHFRTLEEAAEFWDTHDTTDYPDAFKTVPVEVKLKRRHYEVEVAPDARKSRIPVQRLATQLLRKQITLS